MPMILALVVLPWVHLRWLSQISSRSSQLTQPMDHDSAVSRVLNVIYNVAAIVCQSPPSGLGEVLSTSHLVGVLVVFKFES